MDVQVEELKTSPNEPAESAPALAAKALDQELNAPSVAPAVSGQAQVHDLTGLVKKKKKNVDANGDSTATAAAKRKAEDNVEEAQAEKKAKLEETAS